MTKFEKVAVSVKVPSQYELMQRHFQNIISEDNATLIQSDDEGVAVFVLGPADKREALTDKILAGLNSENG